MIAVQSQCVAVVTNGDLIHFATICDNSYILRLFEDTLPSIKKKIIIELSVGPELRLSQEISIYRVINKKLKIMKLKVVKPDFYLFNFQF